MLTNIWDDWLVVARARKQGVLNTPILNQEKSYSTPSQRIPFLELGRPVSSFAWPNLGWATFFWPMPALIGDDDFYDRHGSPRAVATFGG